MRLTNIERETILNFNEDEEIASLYTYNQKLQNRFDKLAEELPELVSRKDNGHGAVTYDLPKKMLILKIQKPISAAERQRRSEYGKATVYTHRHGSRAACAKIFPLGGDWNTPATANSVEHGFSTAVSHHKTHPVAAQRHCPTNTRKLISAPPVEK